MSSFDFGPIKKKELIGKPVVKKEWANKPVVKKVIGEKTIISKTAKIKTPKAKPVIDIEDFRTPLTELNSKEEEVFTEYGEESLAKAMEDKENGNFTTISTKEQIYDMIQKAKKKHV